MIVPPRENVETNFQLEKIQMCWCDRTSGPKSSKGNIFIQPLMAMDGGLNAEAEIFSKWLMLMLLQSVLGMVNWPCLMVLVVNQF